MDKRLYKVREGKMVAGVCLGLSEYFDIDVSIVRLATALLSLFYFTGLVMYIIAAIILPWKEDIYGEKDNFKDNSFSQRQKEEDEDITIE
ncbi:PspC domain-containing protein [Lagierella sp.]|uniref:PspC domain-containing protein n=1 Tax=Lagierella sp. TaxID=2849657 RepID=UPI002606D4FD|nr:PspC domain-containing protein [Lagierella sp.]